MAGRGGGNRAVDLGFRQAWLRGGCDAHRYSFAVAGGQCGHIRELRHCSLFYLIIAIFLRHPGLTEAVETKWIKRDVDGAVRLSQARRGPVPAAVSTENQVAA